MIGQVLGSYQIVAKIGEGGMGEVYRARDTRLNREVALKILPAVLTNDPERLARFRREAQLLAALNHPHIAQIYDTSIDTATDAVFLVMELVPGRTLAEIIQTGGALGPEAAVAVASQIADALETAHEQGIIHRDLKPANIKRRDDDVVKVLDFGLARAMDPAGAGAAEASSSTTLSPAITQHGMILGTAAYMSPEQAKGRAVDKRADIWAFGVVLYEMLTGRPLFSGDTVTEVVAAVLKDAPSLEALPAGTPPALRQLLARCLERDPKVRLRDIGEARIALRTALDPANPFNRRVEAATGAGTSRRRTTFVARAGAAVAVLALAGLAAYAAWRANPESPAVPVRQFELPVLGGTKNVSIAPDGSRLAFLKDGHLWLHTLANGTTSDLGTVPISAGIVFWSPDSRTVGYDADAAIRTMPAGGGVPFTVCKIPATGRVMDAAWLPDGAIAFAVWRDAIYDVPATGGTARVRVALDPRTEIDFHTIVPLPDGRLIVTAHRRGSDARSAELVDGTRRTPITTDPDVEVGGFLSPNHLFFSRSTTNVGVWAAPFEGRTLDLTKAVLVLPGDQQYQVAADGTFVSSLSAKERRELVWVSRSGAVSSVPGPVFEPVGSSVALSPDARRAVIAVIGPDGRDESIVRDLTSGTDTRLPSPRPPTGVTFGGHATWTPSGRLLFPAGGVETVSIFDWPSDGTTGGRELISGSFGRMTSDGRSLLFARDDRGIVRLLRSVIAPDGAAGAGEPLFPGDAQPSMSYFDVAPNGAALAYTTVDPDSEQVNVWVATYPDLRERRRVTADGGTMPRFSRDSRELYYATGVRTAGGARHGQLGVVSIATPPLGVGPQSVLFEEGVGIAAGDRGLALSVFEPAPDGRLLMTRRVPPGPGDAARVVLLQNVLAAIKR